MTDKVDFTNLYALFTRGLAAVQEEDVVEARYVIKTIKEGDFGDRKMVKDAIENYVARSHGEFSYRDICHALHLMEKNDKNNASKILSRMIDRGELVKNGKDFRKPDTELNIMDWKNADTTGIPVKFPLGLTEMVKVFPRNILLLAGFPNSGKSTFCLDFARLNMVDRDIYYFNSEMGGDEFKYRLELFDKVKQSDWLKRFYAFERTDKYEDVIRADEINIIDFLEVTEDFGLVGEKIRRIYDALGKGIALIALQKNYSRDTGRGDSLSLEKARLYLSMNPGTVKIVKCKNWASHENPNNLVTHFKLFGGSEFQQTGTWHPMSNFCSTCKDIMDRQNKWRNK